MKFLNNLFYSKRYLVLDAEMRFEYKTSSGNTIAVSSLEIPLRDKKIILRSGHLWEAEDKILNLKRVKQDGEQISQHLLKESRKGNKISMVAQGAYLQGKHITSVLWDIDHSSIRLKPLTYEEWEDLK